MRYTKWMKRGAALVLALVLALSLLSGCGGEEKLTVSAVLPGEVTTLDPAMVTTDAEKTVVSHLYDNLMQLSPDGSGGVTAVGAMAKSSQCQDNDDGTEVYTFVLRDDITWSDGRDVTADDFVYAWRRLVSGDTASPNASLLNMVSGYSAARSGDTSALRVSATDKRTLEVVLSHRCPYFLSAICTAAATVPVREDDVTLTNGAYAMAQQEGNVLTVTASENYYDEKRRGPDEVRFGLCATEAEAAELYATGEWDAVLGLSEAPSDVAVTEPYPEVGTLLVNQMSQRMDSKSLRQAMAMTVDRNAVAECLGVGFAPAEGLVPPGIRNTVGGDFRADCGAVLDNVPEDYEKNCEMAREKLSKAGYDAEALKKLSGVELLYENTPAMRSVAQLLQATWSKELGITVTPTAVSAEELTEALQKGEFTMALATVRGDRQDASGYLDTWRSGWSRNWVNFHSGAYDMLLRIADASQSAEARDAYLKDAEGLLLDNGYVMPLYVTSRCREVKGNLSGILNDGLGVYHLSNMRKGA